MAKKYRVALIAIFFVACFFRFYNLAQQGFVSWDEGMYMNEVVFYKSIVRAVPQMVRGIVAGTLDGGTLIDMIQGWPPSSAKPVHSFCIFLFSFFLGTTVFTAKAVSAFFGVLSVVMLFVLMRRWYTEPIALCAAFFLGVSGYHVYVSRIGGPETNSVFFLMLAWYWYVESRSALILKKRFVFLVGCGMSLAVSFTMCYRWIIVIPFLWACEGWYLLFSRDLPFRERLMRLIVLTGAFSVLPLMCELPYVPLRFIPDFSVSFRHAAKDMLSYFDQISFYLFAQSKYGAYHFHSLYVHFFQLLNGWVMTSLAGIGCIVLAIRRRRTDLLLLVPLCVPFIMLSVKSRGNSLRYISLCLPFVAASAGIALVHILSLIADRKRLQRIILFGVLISVLFANIESIGNFMSVRSGYAEAHKVLKELGGERHLSTNNAYGEFYFGRNVAEQTPRTIESMRETLEDGSYRYVVLDFMSHRVLEKKTKELIERACVPVRSIPNPIGDNYYFLIESLGYRHFIPGYIREALADPYASSIVIYDARDVLVALRAVM